MTETGRNRPAVNILTSLEGRRVASGRSAGSVPIPIRSYCPESSGPELEGCGGCLGNTFIPRHGKAENCRGVSKVGLGRSTIQTHRPTTQSATRLTYILKSPMSAAAGASLPCSL